MPRRLAQTASLIALVALAAPSALARSVQVGSDGPPSNFILFTDSIFSLQNFTVGATGFEVGTVTALLTNSDDSGPFSVDAFFFADTGIGTGAERVGAQVGTTANSGPVTIGLFEDATSVPFTFNNTTLAANTSYFFGVRNTASTNIGWVVTTSLSNTGANGTVLSPGRLFTGDGGATYSGPFGSTALFTISNAPAAAVPEPGTAAFALALAGLGFGTAVVRRRRARC